MVHEIQVSQYKTVPSSIKLGTFDSYGTEQMHFTFGSGWEDLAVYATFTAPNGKSTQTAVDLEGYTDVPAEATAGEAGQGEIVLIGKAKNINRITVTLHYTVLDHGPVQGDEPAVPTPDLLQQVLTLSKDAQKAAKNAEQSAANAVKDATDTVKPYKEEAAQAAAGAALSEKSAAESKVAAQNAAEVAAQAGIAAGNAADAAEKAAGTATGAAGSSALNAESAQKNAQNAQQSATDAAESQNAAKASADAAAKSQKSAATDAKTATDAKVAAAGSADDAAAAAVAAGNAAGAAAGSQQAAGASEEEAAASERAAKESEQAAAKSAEAALESKNAAATSERNAAASAKKAQGIADSLPADYTTAVGEIAKLKTDKADKTELETVKQKVESITPDDSTVGEKPWSSKNIVDMLCPPLEESGNPVVCYPVAGYPLGVKAKWEPTQEGSGTPYPAGGGKNLLNPADYEAATKIVNGITFTRLNTGEVVIDGTATGTAIYTLIADFAYTVSLSTDKNWAVVGENVISAKGLVSGVTLTRPTDNTKLYIRVASGTTVRTTVQPQIEKGSTPTAYAPYENIRPIKGRDSVTVTRCGENLLDMSVVAETKDVTVDGDKIHVVDTSGWGRSYIIFDAKFPPGTYTITFDVSIAKRGRVIVRPFNADGEKADAEVTTAEDAYYVDANKYYNAYIIVGNNPPSPHKIQFTVTKAAYFQVGFTGGLVNETEIDIINPMIVPGTTAPTTYTPYIGQTATLTLPETVYGGEVDAVSGEGQKVWKSVALDGTENWEKYGNVSEEAAASCFTTIISDKDIGYGTSVCNKFANTKNSAPFDREQMKKFTYTDHPSIKNIYMNYGDNQTVSLDEWKDYLAAQYAAGTPVQVCYKLAEPAPFTATGAQPLPALAGLNTVLTDADSAIITGRADPIKHIEDLEAAAASQA